MAATMDLRHYGEGGVDWQQRLLVGGVTLP
jgi:hypothetical protein